MSTFPTSRVPRVPCSPRSPRSRLCAGAFILLVTLAACGSPSSGAQPTATPTPQHVTYTKIATIPLAHEPTSYDASWMDAASETYYLTDRTDAGVDVFDAKTNTFVTAIAGFAGPTASSTTSGPNAAIEIPGTSQLWVTDGDSSVKIVDLTSHSIVATIKTSGTKRVDGIAYDAQDHLMLVINDNDKVPLATFISTDTHAVMGKITYTQATNGLGAAAWDSTKDVFYLSVPQTTTNTTGEVDVIDPKTMSITTTYAAQYCEPTYVALGPSEHLAVGCSKDALTLGAIALTLIMDANTGKILLTSGKVGACDQVWYNPGDKRFYVAAHHMTTDGTSSGKAAPQLGVFDATTDQWLVNVPTGTDAHSVAVDPVNNRVFMPISGAGIAVYAAS